MPGKSMSTEVVQLDEVERALLDPTAKLSVMEQDSDAAAEAIVRSILEAADPLARVEAVGGRDLLGVPLRVTSVEWRNSDLAGDGLGIFAVLHATQQDGTEVAVTCGSRNVLAQLYRVARDGVFPVDISFSESKPTAKGYTALWIGHAKFEPGAF